MSDATTSPSTEATPTSTEAAGPDDPDAPVVIGHRGASADAPEHTFPSYDLALEQGADYIEQDLQMTADGVLVVLHDDVLRRTARGPEGSCTGPVAEKTLDQLRYCEVGSWFEEADPDQVDAAFADLAIPTMEEVLDRYGPDVRYYIEIKAPDPDADMEEALLALLEDAGLGSPEDGSRQVLVQSFSADSLRRLRSLRPELPLVQLTRAGEPLDAAALDQIAEYAVGVGPAAADVDAELVEAGHARCLVVHPYTVDDPAEMTALLDLGVDGMFTNTPDTLVDAREDHPAPLDPEGCAEADGSS
ncbi:glycerophosphodiester phosphodiesterase [Iamia majanohamensis]|uniref:Glycerophosphodiester phosphodiesterase n=1 Tax=Iamia majanohamensis TaxID=467976 RepID=A0AAF0BVQ6_9ACTN|nr:glycerophosphodiester phosphodiesterase [Iamia majanohamensis]WCO69097.1 glycerophosphodiester phosphodiesterase [Iamia majanohamensis]